MSRRARSEDAEDLQYQDTDSDVPEQRENRVKVKWTPEEDESLKALVKQFGQNEWKLIASILPNRTEQQCQHRWLRVLHPDLVKGPWTKEEDEKVIELVKKCGTKHWTMIAKQLKGRMGKQCRERWHNHLNPEVKKSSWTEEEDRIIYEAHKFLGNRWAEIAKLLPGRTDNAVKNHWNSTIKRKVEMGGFPEGRRAGDQGEPEERADSGCPPAEEQPEPLPAPPADPLEAKVEAAAECGDGDGKSEPQSENEEAPSPGSSLSSAPSSVDSAPEKWMVEYINFLVPGPNPAISDALEMMESDPDGWCDLTNFDLGDDSAVSNDGSPPHVAESSKPHPPNVTEYRLDGHTLSDLRKGSKGELIPISPRPDAGFGTPPSLLKQHKKRRITLSPVSESGVAGNLSLTEANSMTPKSTPVKSLPFSPSQFLNFWSKQDALELENPSLTSTPVCSQKAVVTTPLHRDKTPLLQKNSAFITPNRKFMGENAPRTPTPFKNALEKFGYLRPLPATPHLEEDLKEVLRSESGIELIILDEPRPDRLKRKPGHQRSPIKKVRKSLALDIVDKGPKPPVLPPPPAGTSMQTQPQSGESFLSSSLNESSCSGREENSLLNQGFVQVQTGKEPLVTPEDLSQAPTDIGALVRTQERVAQHAGIDTLLQNKAGALVKTDTCPFVTVDTGALHKTSLNAGMGPAVKADGDAGCKTEIAAPAGATKLRTPALMTSAWKTVAFGGSRDQLLMQEKARAFLTKPKHSSASRTLILS